MLHPWLKIRILPLTMTVAMIFLGIKINQIVEGKERLDEVVISRAIAEESPAPEEKEAEENAPDGEQKEAEVPEAAEAKEDVQKGEEASTGSAEEPTKITVNEGQEEEAPPQEDKREFNQIELDILQSLSKRREEIEKWAEEVKVKEQVLNATEMRIDDKLKKIQNLKTEVETLLAEYKKEEATELRSLVKIYESMKPKDAARIFDELDMDILLDVVDLMAEKKAAPILAGMSPTKAKDLTVELAERRRLQTTKAQDLAGQ